MRWKFLSKASDLERCMNISCNNIFELRPIPTFLETSYLQSNTTYLFSVLSHKPLVTASQPAWVGQHSKLR